MDNETIRALYQSYRSYLTARGKQGAIVWHGGEPLMLGQRRFGEIMALQDETGLRPLVHNKLQTNGLLIDEGWIEFFRKNKIGVGVSIDATPELHDRNRVTPKGEGTYVQTVAALKKLHNAGIRAGALSVASEDARNGIQAVRTLRGLGVAELDLLLPMTNNARQRDPEIAVEASHLKDFMVSAFKEWVRGDDPSMHIRLFSSMILNALDQPTSYLATGGNSMNSLAVVETDGSICLDTEFSQLTRFAMTDDYGTGLNVNDDGFNFDSVEETLRSLIAFVGGDRLPSDCRKCAVEKLCGGGHPGTRYDIDGSHDHRSAHCEVMFAVGHEVLSYLKNSRVYI